MGKLYLLNCGYHAKGDASFNDPLHYNVLYSIVMFHESFKTYTSYTNHEFYSFFPRSIEKTKSNIDFYNDHLDHFANNINYSHEDFVVILFTAHGDTNNTNNKFHFVLDNLANGKDTFSGVVLMDYAKMIAKKAPCLIVGNSCDLKSDLLIEELNKYYNLNHKTITQNRTITQSLKNILHQISPIDVFNISSDEAIQNDVFNGLIIDSLLGALNVNLTLTTVGSSPKLKTKESKEINYPIIILGSVTEKVYFRKYVNAFVKCMTNKPKLNYIELMLGIQKELGYATPNFQSLSALLPIKYKNNANVFETIFLTPFSIE